MRCDVCGQEYLGLHSCSGIQVQVVDEDPPSAKIKFPLFRYFMQGWEIVFWNDSSIRRAGRDPLALVYGSIFFLIGAILPALVFLGALSAQGIPISYFGALIGLALGFVFEFLRVIICHLVAKHILGGTGTLMPLMRGIFLGSVVTWVSIVPLVGGIAAAIGNTVVTMVVFEELEKIERMQAFVISAAVNIGFFFLLIYLLPVTTSFLRLS
jgi:hypothetical protein